MGLNDGIEVVKWVCFICVFDICKIFFVEECGCKYGSSYCNVFDSFGWVEFGEVCEWVVL